jgi:hypothetical protein
VCNELLGSMRTHIRPHTSAYVGVESAYVGVESAYVSIRQHTSVYVSIRQLSEGA